MLISNCMKIVSTLSKHGRGTFLPSLWLRLGSPTLKRKIVLCVFTAVDNSKIGKLMMYLLEGINYGTSVVNF